MEGRMGRYIAALCLGWGGRPNGIYWLVLVYFMVLSCSLTFLSLVSVLV